ncbi:MAG: dTMP kinase [Candidatus Aenigmarchaeota archaeon]|nr:dTMP kinase [Candidatus Aenigmarchaeota archaeon]
MQRQWFVAFEGLDGSGTTTQSKLLAEFLRSEGVAVVLTKEPTEGFVGKRIRAVLRKQATATPLELQQMFVADRREHMGNLVEPALKSGKVVITDRYMFSTLAFGGLGVDMEKLRAMNSAFRVPEMTFIIDVPPDTALDRVHGRLAQSGKRREDAELFEEDGKLERVRANYLRVAKLYPNVHVINGDRKKEEVEMDVRRIVLEKIKL